jgi:hypothetical protein
MGFVVWRQKKKLGRKKERKEEKWIGNQGVGEWFCHLYLLASLLVCPFLAL